MNGRKQIFTAIAALLIVFCVSCTKDETPSAAKTHGRSGSTTLAPSSSIPSTNTQQTTPPKGTPNTAEPGPEAAVNPIKPVEVGEEARLLPDVSLKITKVEKVELQGRGAGDSTGPGIAVYVTLENASDSNVDFSTLAVVAESQKGTPLIPSRSEPASTPTGNVKPGTSSSAVWTFHTVGSTSGVLIQASHPSSPNIVQFKI